MCNILPPLGDSSFGSWIGLYLHKPHHSLSPILLTQNSPHSFGGPVTSISKVFKSLTKGGECVYSKTEMSRFGNDPEATFKYSKYSSNFLQLKLNCEDPTFLLGEW